MLSAAPPPTKPLAQTPDPESSVAVAPHQQNNTSGTAAGKTKTTPATTTTSPKTTPSMTSTRRPSTPSITTTKPPITPAGPVAEADAQHSVKPEQRLYEGQALQTIELPGKVFDTALGADGRMLFLLTHQADETPGSSAASGEAEVPFSAARPGQWRLVCFDMVRREIARQIDRAHTPKTPLTQRTLACSCPRARSPVSFLRRWQPA